MEITELSRYLMSVDKKLKKVTATNNPILRTAVSRFINAQGKRLRPSLVITTAVLGGGKVDGRIINAAAAIELLHIGSLVHDDIMDKGKLRWNMPTISSLEGQDTAILAGDFLLAKACSLAGSISSEAGVLIAETITEMCEGQGFELDDKFNVLRTEKSLLRAINAKTASLFSASCRLGGMLAGLKGMRLDALSEYGRNFGISYQLLDDVADFTGSTELSGKSVGGDARGGNYNLPVILSLRGRQKDKLRKLLQSKVFSSGEVLEILMADGSIEKTIAESEKYKQKAQGNLDVFNDTDLTLLLKSF